MKRDIPVAVQNFVGCCRKVAAGVARRPVVVGGPEEGPGRTRKPVGSQMRVVAGDLLHRSVSERGYKNNK